MAIPSTESNNKIGDSFKFSVVSYIERCRLEDGGYFFARVPPSSGMDTYFAVQSLAILGITPDNPQSVIDFFVRQYKAGTLNGTAGIFTAVETLNHLGSLDKDIKEYARRQIMSLQNQAGAFGAIENVDIEVISELQETYRAVKVLKTINADFDRHKISSFILSELNADGGYGKGGYSTLSSTYYATAIHKLLGNDVTQMAASLNYLRKTEEAWRIEFIEDAYRLTIGLANLGEKTRVPDRMFNFVLECRRPSGGFSRATDMGIATLEYTYYALSILRAIDAL